MNMPAAETPQRVMLLGATGTIGRATARALLARGHAVVCPVRGSALAGIGGKAGPSIQASQARRAGQASQAGRATQESQAGQADQPVGAGTDEEAHLGAAGLPLGCDLRQARVLDAVSLERDGFRGESFDALVSCMASRTGAPQDAWAVDHAAHLQALRLAQAHGVRHFVYLSALCVQKPRLAFQHAKLAFEQALVASGLSHSIVRPTAFFKSLSGQVARVRAGKPFVVFGHGELTACKPIADEDLADFIVDCVERPARHQGVLPLGGPGPAITPRMQAQALERLLRRPVRLRRVPVAVLDAAVALLSTASRVVPALAPQAELARIGRYYATESMLVWDEARQRYDAEATASYGTRSLFDFYAQLIEGRARADLGDHAVF